MNLPKLAGHHFDHNRWRAETPLSVFKLDCSRGMVVENRSLLHEFAVGYCRGKHLGFRPKGGNYGVMFFKDGVHFWFHLNDYEFSKVFKES